MITLPGCWTCGKVCWHILTARVGQARVNRADTLRALATLLERVMKSEISDFLTLTGHLLHLGFRLLICPPSVVTGMVHFPAPGVIVRKTTFENELISPLSQIKCTAGACPPGWV